MPRPTALALRPIVAVIAGLAVITAGATPSGAAHSIDLGVADSFAVLASSTVTNTGPTVISGDLGVSPGTSITGFPPGVQATGTVHQTDAVASQARMAATAAYNDAASRAVTANAPQDIGGLTFTDGVYAFASSAQLTGSVTLDAQNSPDAVFIFQIPSTLTTASDASVVLTNGANPCNVFWQVGSSATIGTDSDFAGTILASASVTMNTGATIEGRLLALNGAVTLDTNVVSRGACAATTTTTSTSTTTTAAPTSTTPAQTTTSTTAAPTTTTEAPATTTTEPPPTGTTPPTEATAGPVPPTTPGTPRPLRPAAPSAPDAPAPPPLQPPPNSTPPELPRTGSGATALTYAGISLLIAGAVLTAFSGRRASRLATR